MAPPARPDPASVDDLTLVRRAVAGDQHAAHEFYHRHATVLLRLAAARMRDQAAAEDVVHDAFERLWGAVRRDAVTPGSDGTLRGLLLTITHRRSLDLLRSAWQRRTTGPDGLETVRDPGPGPDDEAARTAHRTQVYELIDEVAEPYRQILLLTLAGYGIGEIAELTGRRPNTVSQQRRRAFARARDAAADRGMVDMSRHDHESRAVLRTEVDE